MAPYRRAYMFTGEPTAAEDAADWLAALETNMYPSMTSHDNANLFSTKLFRKSPAKRWFNALPDEVQHRWHLLKPEFKLRWCMSASSPSLVTQISTVSVAVPAAIISCTPAISAPAEHSTPITISPPSPASDIPPSKPLPLCTPSDATNMISITKNDLDWMLEKAYRDGFAKGIADTTGKLKAKHEEDLKQAVTDIMDSAQERCDEEFVSAFEIGCTSGIQDQCKYQESLRKPQIDVSIQVDLPLDDNDTLFTPAAVDNPLSSPRFIYNCHHF